MKTPNLPRWRLLLALITLLGLASGCVRTSSAPLNPATNAAQMDLPAETQLTVAAASDLQFAFSDMAALYEQSTGQAVTLVFASTGQLAQHVENGAPYDLLAAADRVYIDELAQKNLVVPETVRLYALGHIVLAVNRQSGAQAFSLGELLSEQVRYVAIANPEHAPYGQAARQALEAAGLWESIQGKLVMGENVRQTLQYVQSGDAQAGIVSRSIADVPEVSWTLIDEGLYTPLEQALAVVTASPNQAEAEAFAAFVNSEPGRQIMQRYGFGLPPAQASP